MHRLLTAFAIVSFVMGFSANASAHAVGISQSRWTVTGTRATGGFTFAKTEFSTVFDAHDSNKDRSLDDGELKAAKQAIEAKFKTSIIVTGNGRPCPATLNELATAEQDGIRAQLTFQCETAISTWKVSLPIVNDMSDGHRHFLSGASPEEIVLARANLDHTTTMTGNTPVAEHAPTRVGELFKLGIEHILTGYDHLLFLFGLILVGGRIRALVAVITAFTIAHSVTLAMAVLNWYSPRPSIVEPAIALSIAYVGIENFFVKDANKRWRITFPFGLIHGFGFAGALQEIQLDKGRIAPALVLFNLGVETGQLAVLAILLPAILWARTKPWFVTHGVRVLSAAIIVMGLIWFVQRVMEG